MTVIGCDNGSTNGNEGLGNPNVNGTWTKGINTLILTGNNFTFLVSSVNGWKGTFSTTGTTSGNLTLKFTHFWDIDEWHPMSYSETGSWSLSNNILTIGGLESSGIDNVNGDWIKY